MKKRTNTVLLWTGIIAALSGIVVLAIVRVFVQF